ncbi:hypothetical protein RV15_GL001762 [Enterococcus silesiacus]|uniref:Uncharacterized protein n=1 Tax=Enterococcus silesiacus TaxID=332949 RepID=A0AA91G7V3_9ENTE|nr:hypothetical protein RV15_GL001762 [Enterococcus silesiacus]
MEFMKMFIEQSDNRKIEILDYLIRASGAVTFSELVEVMP